MAQTPQANRLWQSQRVVKNHWGLVPITICIAVGLTSTSGLMADAAATPAPVSVSARNVAVGPRSAFRLLETWTLTPGSLKYATAAPPTTSIPSGPTFIHPAPLSAVSICSIRGNASKVGEIAKAYSCPAKGFIFADTTACCSSDNFLGALNFSSSSFASAARALASEIFRSVCSLKSSNATSALAASLLCETIDPAVVRAGSGNLHKTLSGVSA